MTEPVTIDVIVLDRSGEVARAEALTPEAAVFAAETLRREAREAWPVQGYARTLSTIYAVDGKTVRLLTEGRSK